LLRQNMPYPVPETKRFPIPAFWRYGLTRQPGIQ